MFAVLGEIEEEQYSPDLEVWNCTSLSGVKKPSRNEERFEHF